MKIENQEIFQKTLNLNDIPVENEIFRRGSVLKSQYKTRGLKARWGEILETLGLYGDPEDLRLKVKSYERKFGRQFGNDYISDDDLGLSEEEKGKIYEEEIKVKDTSEYSEGGTYTFEKWDFSYFKDKHKDLNYLLNVHGFDKNFWKITYAKSTIHQMVVKKTTQEIDEETGKRIKTVVPIKVDLVCTRITVKPREEPAFDIDNINNVLANYNFNNTPISIKPLNKTGELCAEVNFADAHCNRLPPDYYKDTYDGNYIDLYLQQYQGAIDQCIDVLVNLNISKILFIVGQDYLNSDNLIGTTTKGTPQDNEKFYTVAYQKAFKNLVDSVEKLKRVAPVTIIYVRGNHDSISTWTMCEALKYIYLKDSNITFDIEMNLRKYFTFGENLIGFSHGDKEKNRIYEVMQQEVPHLWNRKYRYFHTSHIHVNKVTEKNGIVFETVSSPAKDSLWEDVYGYVNTKQFGNMFIYHLEDGMMEKHYIPFK